MRRLLLFCFFSLCSFAWSLCSVQAQGYGQGGYGAVPANADASPAAPVPDAVLLNPNPPLPAGAVPGDATVPGDAETNGPDVNNDAPDDNPDATPAQTPPGPYQNPPDKPKRVPRRNQVEMRLRVMMSDFGLDEPLKQDALIAYLAEDEAGKAKVRDAARRLLGAIKLGVSDDRMRDLVAVYKGALDADHERRVAAQTALDAKIGYTLSPRLEAVLWLFGVLGEGGGGLPFGALSPRMASRNPGNPTGRIDDGTRNTRGGVVFGTLTAKGEGWIEVQDSKGACERYMPFWAVEKNADAGYDRAVLDAIENLKIGDRVRLEWVWSERKRVVKIENWVPNPPAPVDQNIPQNEAPPALVAP